MNNLVVRTISGTVFLGILLAGIIFHPFGYLSVFLFVVTVGLYEFYAILLPPTFPLRKVLGYLIALLLFGLFHAKGFGLIGTDGFVWLVIPAVALFVAELYSGSEKPFAMIAAVLTGIVYVALPFALLAELAFSNGNYDYRIVLSLFIILWSNDVGAYCFGIMFGRGGKHKLFERISPKKSWEGFWGGLIAALSAGVIMSSVWDDRYCFGLFHWLMLSVIVSLAAVFGDLAESMLKRSAGIKDSGHIMPGHGGILDRFDGALLAFPCALAYINILNLL